MPVYANQYVDEGTLDGEKVITLEWKAKRVVLTNDSSGVDLKFKLNTGEDYATLRAGETLTMEYVSLRNIYLLSGALVTYRLWVQG